jgi:RNA polymerase sigma factor for flagellar operon FliA
MTSVAVATESRNELLLDHYELARKIAYRMYHRLPKVLDVDDLVGAAVMGLFDAIDRFDAHRAVPFESFAKHRIQGAIMDALRAADWTPTSVRRKSDLLQRTRTTLGQRLGRTPSRDEMTANMEISTNQYDALVSDAVIRPVLSLDAPTGEGHDSSLAEVVRSDDDFLADMETEELKVLIQDARQSLPERERTAIDLHFYRDMKLKDVGETLGVTESRACQLCKQGIARMRKRLQPRVH